MLGGIGMALGGLAPLITGIVGIHGYLTQGYFIAKTGERIGGPLGLSVCGLFVLAGLAMIAYGVRAWLGHGRPAS